MIAVEKSGTFRIGGELEVYRMGFGAMRLVGARPFSPAVDVDGQRAVLRRALELGVNFIDTADAYGPYLNEDLLAAALRPYPKRLVIGTKGGAIRLPGSVVFNSHPLYLRQALEGSLRRLKLECIDLYQVHRLDGDTPVEDTVGELARLRGEGKLRHIGLSEVKVDQLARARAVSPIASVQNLYNLQNRDHEDVLAYCDANGIGFIPWYPLGSGKLGASDSPIAPVAQQLQTTPAKLALAWLLAKSPNMILIPGTSSREHLEENVKACDIQVSDADLRRLETACSEKLASD